MTENETSEDDNINAEPTKAFFIDMLTRDIQLEQAILDLVDNCVDGAKALKPGNGGNFEGLRVTLQFDSSEFKITDNCGGFDKETAKSYAFRFGRPEGSKRTPNSIGQFGVGMKRALFKFGKHFEVRSSTKKENWAVIVPVNEWEKEKGWKFPFSDFPEKSGVSLDSPGTEIIVTELRKEVSSRFSLKHFENTVFKLLRSKHRQFISEGLTITVNGRHVDATNLLLLTNKGLNPGIDILNIKDGDNSPVRIKIIVAVGNSSPQQAGWYVICNGRVVLEADRSANTGWGAMEESQGKILIPGFHNQFARFRGLVFFESEDSSLVPWNTTKTNVDLDNKYWIAANKRMLEMMRTVIDFLNELDADIDEHSKEESPLNKFVTKSDTVMPNVLETKTNFMAPKREELTKTPKKTRIQFMRFAEDVELLMKVFELDAPKEVGEMLFDNALARQKR